MMESMLTSLALPSESFEQTLLKEESTFNTDCGKSWKYYKDLTGPWDIT